MKSKNMAKIPLYLLNKQKRHVRTSLVLLKLRAVRRRVGTSVIISLGASHIQVANN